MVVEHGTLDRNWYCWLSKDGEEGVVEEKEKERERERGQKHERKEAKISVCAMCIA